MFNYSQVKNQKMSESIMYYPTFIFDLLIESLHSIELTATKACSAKQKLKNEIDTKEYKS